MFRWLISQPIKDTIMSAAIKLQSGDRIPDTRLTYLEERPKSHTNERQALFKCDCGNQVERRVHSVRYLAVRSCGCRRREMTFAKNTEHSHTVHGEQSEAYRSYAAMLQRLMVDSKGQIGERWLGVNGFFNFLADLGNCLDGHVLERVDSLGDYEASNCVWAPCSVQSEDTCQTLPTAHECRATMGECTVGDLIINDDDKPAEIEDCKPLDYPENRDQLIDPYTVGVLLGRGSMNGKATGAMPVVLMAHEDDWPTYEREIPYPLGKVHRGKCNPETIARTICDINAFVSMNGLSSYGDDKRVPEEYLVGSVQQRLAVLQGLMDTSGSCSEDGDSTFSSNSRCLVEDVMFLVRSLGGQAHWVSTGKTTHFEASLRLDMLIFRLARKAERQRH
jgi:hypothetical protein